MRRIVADAAFDDIDPALIERFRAPRARDDREALAQKLAIASPDEDGELRPTVAGILLCTHHPERWVRNAFIQAVAYRGKSVSESMQFPYYSESMQFHYYQVDARDLFGPLDVQVADACHFVLKNQKVAARKTMGRVDYPQYDMTAVFEAVVNAVAHRDYSAYGSKIRLQMFADRIDLYSPGGLAGSLTVETLAYRQATRNEAIASPADPMRCPVHRRSRHAQRQIDGSPRRGRGGDPRSERRDLRQAAGIPTVRRRRASPDDLRGSRGIGPMNKATLMELIANGENSGVEFKARRSAPRATGSGGRRPRQLPGRPHSSRRGGRWRHYRYPSRRSRKLGNGCRVRAGGPSGNAAVL